MMREIVEAVKQAGAAGAPPSAVLHHVLTCGWSRQPLKIQQSRLGSGVCAAKTLFERVFDCVDAACAQVSSWSAVPPLTTHSHARARKPRPTTREKWNRFKVPPLAVVPI
jgi:hypothetical protein